MRADEREAVGDSGVLERSVLPDRDAVALLAVGREAGGDVVDGGRPLVVGLVAGEAVVLSGGVEDRLEAGDGVAGRALDLGVRADEREPVRGGDVVEAACGGEGERVVAGRAVRREAGRDVVDGGGRLVVGSVAGEAVRVERGEEAVGVFGVAALAGDLEVRAGERERRLRVDELAVEEVEILRVVARLACVAELAAVDVEVAGGALVGGEVGLVEAEVEVTRVALQLLVLARHHEAGLLAVVEVDLVAERGPGLRGVAGLTGDRDVAVRIGERGRAG